MKDFRGMKRQRGRNRNTKPSGNQNNPNRAYESTGPESTKVRGNAQTIYEKYQQLARDANSSGDRVLAENFLQHAEHYFRLIRQMQPTRPVSEFVQRDPFSNFYDIDEDGDSDGESTEAQTETVEDAGFEETESAADTESRQRDNRDRDDRNNRDRNDRNNRDRNDRNRDRNDRNRDRDRSENRPDNRSDNRQQQRPEQTPEFRSDAQRHAGEDGDTRRESRRDRYERRRQQRLSEQETSLSIAPSSTDPLGPPPVLASTQPFTPAVSAPQPDMDFAPRPKPEPDHSHLPAFLRNPAPISEASSEVTPEAPVAKKTRAPKAVPESDTGDEAVPRPRARRKKAEATSEEA